MIILTVHGMGETSRSYADPLRSCLERELGATLWRRVVFAPIYYQDLIQKNQYDVWSRMRMEGSMDWSALRKFMLFSFSDAATLEHQSEYAASAYVEAQLRIRETIDGALAKAGATPTTPVAVIGHSLGGQVISNYIWDSQQQTPKGVWLHHPLPADTPQAKDSFLRLRNLKLMLTTGCNIPLFVAGLRTILPFDSPSAGFKWQNFYDRDDPLGWPLRPLSPEYKRRVNADVEVNVGGLFTNWNPLSHEGYWTDKDFIKPACKLLRQLITQ